MGRTSSIALVDELAKELTEAVTLRIYYLSTPSTPSCSLYSEPPGQQDNKTYCQRHFLAASISVSTSEGSAELKEVLIYAIEVLIYSTIHNTTFFVSKVDSSGYLSLLGLSRDTASPIQTLSSTFIHHLIQTHRQPNLKNVISLFARAQDQYLFPRSVEFKGKHVLDDRGLIRWWCRTLNSIIDKSALESKSTWTSVKGHLLVPGLDSRESLLFIPERPNDSWTISHPLLEISGFQGDVLPRYLVPHFPDDPKARYLDELDIELSKSDKSNGQWRSIKTVDQFWEMMACRQECSAGRLVGFAWVVFTPNSDGQHAGSNNKYQTNPTSENLQNLKNNTRQSRDSNNLSVDFPRLNIKDITNSGPQACQLTVKRASLQRKKLTGPIVPRKPRVKSQVKSHHGSSQLVKKLQPCENEDEYRVIVDQQEYKRVIEFLLHLDFSNFERASSSTKRWIDEIRCAARNKARDYRGQTITGTKKNQTRAESSSVSVSTLDSGLIRKKRKKDSTS